MAASFATEVMKLRKRPATWILVAVLVLLIVFLDYFQFYSTVASLEEEGGQTAAGIGNVGDLKEYILPQSFAVNVPGLLSQFGGPVALILGALASGSEYGWNTMKTAFTQGLGRMPILGSRLLAVALALLGFSILILAVGAGASYVVASLLEESAEWPSVVTIIKSAGATFLIFGAWAGLGVFLATLFRGTALAIGIGLVWGVVVESVIFSVAAESEVVEAVTYALLARNGGDLANSLGNAPQTFSAQDPVSGTQAALVLGAYLTISLLLTALLVRHRDVD